MDFFPVYREIIFLQAFLDPGLDICEDGKVVSSTNPL